VGVSAKENRRKQIRETWSAGFQHGEWTFNFSQQRQVTDGQRSQAQAQTDRRGRRREEGGVHCGPPLNS
jgi:hypothetical protein